MRLKMNEINHLRFIFRDHPALVETFRIFHYFFFRNNRHGKTFVLANHDCHPNINKTCKIVFKEVGMGYNYYCSQCAQAPDLRAQDRITCENQTARQVCA